MTLRDVLDEIDKLNPNDVAEERKVAWLTGLEKQLLDEVLRTHRLTEAEAEKAAEIAAAGDALEETYVPLAQPPHSDVYRFYADAQIALANVDTVQYENAQQLYNGALMTYKNWFNRTHRTLAGGEKARF